MFAALAVWLLGNGMLMQPGILTILLFVACMFLAFPGRSSVIRHGALYGFGFTQGWLAAPLVNYVMLVNPSTVFVTILATMAIFGSFTMSAYFSPRRQYLYLGGLLGTILSMMMIASFANAFIGSSAFANVELYIGLFVFALYVLYDTQVIVERAEDGNHDDVTHSMTLFTDIAAIFVRLLIILSKDKEDNRRRRK
jgi:FtsH-binding integral membrane protein